MKLCPICATTYPAGHRTCPTHGTILVETQELPEGSMIRDCYRIVRMLGKGGMGTVYLAEHTLMGEPRALKFLSADLASNPLFVQRFLQEARAANKLRHPNVAQTMELGQTEDGSFYISMEYVDGPSLRAALSQSPGGLPLARAFQIVQGVAAGLGAAHAKRMVHRDIKPENILLASTPEGEVAKVVDFGIVAMSDGAGRLTQTGSVLLTCEYAAPEQWRGTIPSSELDGRTDLYSVGCMFFEMLTGRLPFKSDSYEGWFELHVRTAPPAPSSIRPQVGDYPGLDALVLKLLEKERDNRPANVAEFLADLDRVLSGSPPLPAYIPTPLPAPIETGRLKTVVEATSQSAGLARTDAGTRYVSGPESATISPAPAQTPVQGEWTVPATGLSGSAAPAPAIRLGQPQATAATPGQGFAPPPPVAPPFAPPPVAGPPQFPPQAQRPVPAKSRSNTGLILFILLGLVVILAVGGGAAFYLYKTGKLFASPSQSPSQTATTPQTQQPAVSIAAPTPDSSAASGQPAVPDTSAFGQPAPATPSPAPETAVVEPPKTPTPRKSNDAGGSAALAQQADDLYTSKQYAQAQPMLLQSCNHGHAESCNYLGVMYQFKLGIDQDYAQSASLYTKACTGNNMLGCNNLAFLYQHKLGVDQDYSRALTLYQKACNGGEPSACNSLGVMYQKSQGVDQDLVRASTLYQKACDGGNANGCSDLGYLYLNGTGVARDADKARTYLGKGCSMGNKFGCDQLKQLN